MRTPILRSLPGLALALGGCATLIQNPMQQRAIPGAAAGASGPTAGGASGALASFVVPGSRVRVSAADHVYPFTGRVTAVRGDTLEFLPDGDGAAIALPLSAMTGLDRSLGRRSHLLAGAGIGIASGAVLGGLVGSIAYQPCTETGFLACMFRPTSRSEAAGLGAVLGGLGGAAVGALIGAGTSAERWQAVPLAGARVAVTRLPAGRTGIGLGFRF